jgi:tetratricopeptide (TPR) repeat protein
MPTTPADPIEASRARLAEAVVLHQAGRLEAAASLYEAVLRDQPEQPDGLHLLGLIAHQRGDDAAAVSLIGRALQQRAAFPVALNNLANILRGLGRRAEAAAHYRQALELRPELVAAEIGLAGLSADVGDLEDAARRLDSVVARQPPLAQAWCELGRVRRRQRRFGDAIAALERAVALEPGSFAAHNELGIALHETGRWDDAVARYREALACKGEPAVALRNLGHALKRLGRTAEAVACYRGAASHRLPDAALDDATAALATYATTSQVKLAHDIEQLSYLTARGCMDAASAPIENYRAVLDTVARRSAPGTMVRLTDDERRWLGPHYNRLLHVANAPAQPEGPFGAWRSEAIEETYLAARPELAVIDDFLSPAALAALRRYCLESTLWFDFSHRDGYLAAFIDDHFDCPLLLQIADGLRRALPRIVGPHSLRHLWGYKYDSTLAGVGLHGDDAAVNVNFWITPDDANLDPESGGMIVHPAIAPADWRFEDFNADTARIEAFLAAEGAVPIKIGYRANRAVLFNSSLFHETDRFRFRPGYATRRINITLLFGDRAAPSSDFRRASVHHP